jgi:hypothetical protein
MVKAHSNRPYQETLVASGKTETVIRKFSEYSDSNEFKWHWDEEDRLIHMVHKTDWKLQLDNELPIQIKSTIRISKGTWHRLIKGTGDLSIIVEKIKDI